MRALEEDILAQAPQLSARPSPVPPVLAVPAVPVLAGGDLAPAAAPPYLGRDAELDEVTGPLADCLAGLAAREPARIALGGLDVAATGQLIAATCARPVGAETATAIAR